MPSLLRTLNKSWLEKIEVPTSMNCCITWEKSQTESFRWTDKLYMTALVHLLEP